jgi:multidrug efflux pump subunit AcrA (membrane-fusion protein)
MPNLMERSRTYWRDRLRRTLVGGTRAGSAPLDRRERAILATFGSLSLGYSVALRAALLVWVGSRLADTLHLAGLVFTGLLALVYSRRLVVPLASAAVRRLAASTYALRRIIMGSSRTVDASQRTMPRWRRLVAPCGVAVVVAGGLSLPWRASVGNYGTIAALPDREQIVRAPERGLLVEIAVRPGDTVAANTVLGRMRNPDLDGELVDVRAELSRVVRDEGRLLGELAVRGSAIARADAFLRQRQIEVDEMAMEHRQIQDRRRVPEPAPMRLVLASAPDPSRGSATAVPPFPPAIAVLQADVDLRHARLAEAASQLDRIRRLAATGLVARSELELIESRAATGAIDLSAARERLETALVEHRRRRTALGTDMQLARADSAAERLQVERLTTELRAARALLGALEERRALLERMQASLRLVARRDGAVLGEELVRSAGRYFERGEEICRIADTRQLLVRIDVPERELADVRVGRPVRVKVPAHVSRVFHGSVARIAGEGMRDTNGRTVYRVELTVDNDTGLLRPGMTAFARIEFGRQAVARTLWHKARQLLRSELWLLL